MDRPETIPDDGTAAGVGGVRRAKCEGSGTGETATVTAVKAGDRLILDSGLAARLTGIETPHRDWPMAEEARAALDGLAMGRRVARLYAGGRRLTRNAPAAPQAARTTEPVAPVPDPATPALAQVYVKTETAGWIWLQEAMVKSGMARANSRRGNYARAGALLKTDTAARQAKLGVWATPAFALHRPDSAASAGKACQAANRRRRQQIVEGQILAAHESNGRLNLNFGSDPMAGFTIALDTETAPAWPGGANQAGHQVPVRGHLSDRGGTLVRVDHIAQIEDLGARQGVMISLRLRQGGIRSRPHSGKVCAVFRPHAVSTQKRL